MDSQTLPQKDQGLFKQLVKHYESKQYKKGVKMADTILKTFPDHGETLCMKGLLLNCLGKKEEALDLAKKGLKANIKSHVCWHVLGLIHRAEHNYVEASRCYKSALRMDPSNLQIMRDLCVLQLNQRDLAGYSETRRQLLVAKPTQKQNWIAFAVAEQIRGAPEAAIDILNKMEESFKDSREDGPMSEYEKSEFHLYRVMLLMESNQAFKAWDYLSSAEKEIVDSIARLELTVYLAYLNQGATSTTTVTAVRQLIQFNSSHEGYLLCAMAAEGLLVDVSSEQIKKWLDLEDCGFSSAKEWSADEFVNIGSMAKKVSSQTTCLVLKKVKFNIDGFSNRIVDFKTKYGIPSKCDTMALLELCLMSADEGTVFRTTLKDWIVTKLRKEIPSIFKMIKSLLLDEAKRDIVVQVMTELVAEEKDSTSSPFMLLAFAQMQDYLGDHTEAFQSVTNCVEEISAINFETSKTDYKGLLVDAYLCQSKILKHLGRLVEASAALEAARQLDLSDRYVNSKSAKGLLRCGEIEKAKEIIHLFSKDTANAQKSNLNDMQASWWFVELAKAHIQRNEFHAALTCLYEIRKFYKDMVEDEFDFSFYCLRKMTLRAYVEFIRLEDKLMNHKAYVTMVGLLLPLLLQIVDGSIVVQTPTPSVEVKDHATEAVTMFPNWCDRKVALTEAESIVAEMRKKKATSWIESSGIAEELESAKKNMM